MYKLTMYVPDSHLESLKQALFAAGAGQVGDYAQCCWQIKGLGQFFPRADAQPFIGQIGQLTQVEEWRVEMVMLATYRQAVLEALRRHHALVGSIDFASSPQERMSFWVLLPMEFMYLVCPLLSFVWVLCGFERKSEDKSQ